ncbi:hypothetical protein GCM10010215_08440 [Streptomyces virginiae]|uniref:Uncharacterized protein n=1 Tax=Streptomyces virginiae TaxID=1961 RepID=A0ABQ3NSQ5_STRVG|nr:hypothetical protein [Streptomyces virginiae]MBP2345525.1 hypothetical protein [Streptomyces virginiae]GGP85254.1 hypothetical protein GCM10010215_08440 [Streptomyces virginiae]GHI15813.1 hypothetical protein Scinn_52760 [Streptomyces virginiae]
MLIASTALILATLAGYTLLCMASPFGTCRKCQGAGAKHTVNRAGKLKKVKPCRRCHGQGKRLRVGRRLHNHSREIHSAGSR